VSCRVTHWCVGLSLSTRRYNGFGGKVEDGELPAQAALRELKVCTAVLNVVITGHLTPHTKEECGIEAPLNHCGTLLFVSKGAPWAFQIEIYRSDAYSGTLIEFAFFSVLPTLHISCGIEQDGRDAT
jgi:hypothetical protein